MALAQVAFAGYPALLQRLLNEGADVDQAWHARERPIGMDDGCTALQCACHNGHAACAKLLLDRGANIDKVDDMDPSGPSQRRCSGCTTCR